MYGLGSAVAVGLEQGDKAIDGDAFTGRQARDELTDAKGRQCKLRHGGHGGQDKLRSPDRRLKRMKAREPASRADRAG